MSSTIHLRKMNAENKLCLFLNSNWIPLQCLHKLSVLFLQFLKIYYSFQNIMLLANLWNLLILGINVKAVNIIHGNDKSHIINGSKKRRKNIAYNTLRHNIINRSLEHHEIINLIIQPESSSNTKISADVYIHWNLIMIENIISTNQNLRMQIWKASFCKTI